MKIFILLAMTTIFIACSSAKKQPDTTEPPTPTAAQNSVQKSVKTDSDIIKKEICESDKDQRFLEVHKKVFGCDLSYDKFGKSKIVASGKFGTKHCEESLNKITKKLEAQEFHCHPI